VRQLFELEDFGESEAVERFREMGVGTEKYSRCISATTAPYALQKDLIQTNCDRARRPTHRSTRLSAIKPDTLHVRRLRR
jgi:hypothetical protein